MPTSSVSCRSSVLQQALAKHQNVSSRAPPNLMQGTLIYRTTRLCRRSGDTAASDLPFVSPCAEQRDIAHRTGSWHFITHCGLESFAKHQQRDTLHRLHNEMTRSGSRRYSSSFLGLLNLESACVFLWLVSFPCFPPSGPSDKSLTGRGGKIVAQARGRCPTPNVDLAVTELAHSVALSASWHV